MKTLLALLAVAALCVPTGALAAVPPPFSDEFLDLNNDLFPPPWVVDVWWGHAGVEDEKLTACPVDACCRLEREGTWPAGATGITLEYDGNIAYAYWGLVNGAGVALPSDTFMVMDAMAEYNFGLVNRAVVVQYPVGLRYDGDLPLEYTDYHYTADFTEGHVRYRAVKIAGGTTLFDISVGYPGLHLADIQQVFFHAYATTQNCCWLDNLSVKVQYGGPQIPTLSEWGAIIFGALLLGSVVFYIWRRRRVVIA